MQRALRTLTALQHVLFVVLALVCVGRSLTTGAPVAPVVALAVALLGWYAVGAASSLRHPAIGLEPLDSSFDTTGATSATGATGASGGPGRAGALWLLGLTVIWLALVALSPENVWLAFSLWLLAGHFLRTRWALLYSAAVLAVVVLAPWSSRGGLTLAEVLGPLIGAMFALVVSRGQVELVREVIERQRLVRSLVAAQEEAEALHADLAQAHREAGALAERTRLSRDIHDTLAQGFSSMLLLARAGRAAPEPERLPTLLEQIETTAATGLDEARRVVGALAPRDLEDAGLPSALRRALDALGRETGIATELRLDGEVGALPTTVEVALLRTAQGALANVRRHARADRVVVSLSELEDSVRLDVVDDGVGFDPAATRATAAARVSAAGAPSAGGYGLPSTRARLRELGGDLVVESAPGEGTALGAHVPLPGRLT